MKTTLKILSLSLLVFFLSPPLRAQEKIDHEVIDKNAFDSSLAKKSYKNSIFKLNRKLTATGYKLVNPGGI